MGLVIYSVVIPVYNSSETLELLTSRLVSVLNSLAAEYEILFVDDCSSDRSWIVLKELKDIYSQTKIIRLMRNFGQHNAIMCGFHHAQGKYVITMDDDLQNPPEEIPVLAKQIQEGFDIVYGQYSQKKHARFRNLGSDTVQWVYRKIFHVKGNLTSFRILDRSLVDALKNFDTSYTFIDGPIAWLTKNIGYVDVKHEERRKGGSTYSVGKLLTLSLNMLTNFSIYPLQLASFTGFVFSFLGIAMALYFFIKKIVLGIPVTGFASTIIAITCFSGVQLLALGLMGEYIGRIHLNINRRPQFIVREKKLD